MNELVLQQRQISVQDFFLVVDTFRKGIDVVKDTIITYNKGINDLTKFLNRKNITYLNRDVLLEWKNDMRERKLAPNTITTYLSGVRNAFNFMEDYGVPNLMRTIKGDTPTEEFHKQPLTKAQALRILKDMEQKRKTLKEYRDFAIFNLLIRNGLREKELEQADITDIKQINGQIVLKIIGKGQKEKQQSSVLTDATFIPILAYLKKRGKDSQPALFIGLAHNEYGTRLHRRSISRLIKNILVSYGYDSSELTAHSLRHSATTYALKGGATLQQAQKLARHKDVKTTLKYAHNVDRYENPPEAYVDAYLESEEN